LKIFALFILIIFSGFFSGSEVALFSLDRKKIKNYFGESNLISRYISELLERPRRLLVVILLGNTTVNVSASIVGVSLALDFSAQHGISADVILTIQILVLTISIILFGELLPKVWASKNVIAAAKISAIPMFWIAVILFPIAETITEFIKSLSSRLNFDKSKTAILPEDISELTDIVIEHGKIEDEEHGLINSLVSFRSVTVGEIMTPRVDMISIEEKNDFRELLKLITETAHSRIPLFKNDLDEIIGIIYAKDILKFLKETDSAKDLQLNTFARKAYFVPKSKLIDELLQEFQTKRMHIAIVVDEYGGTAGMITMEDIIEEVVGEIRDEFDKEENSFTKLSDGQYLALGKLSIEELNEYLDESIEIENKDFETLAGYLINEAGTIPREGFSIKRGKYKFVVKEVFKKRITKVLIEEIQA
jgi:gliding motility-associated protein GldE